MIKNISNLGDAALYCDFGDDVNKSTNSRVIKYFYNIKDQKFEGINNLTPSYNKLIISFDLKKTNYKEIKKKLENLNINTLSKISGKEIEIPVCCEQSFSLDIKKITISAKVYVRFELLPGE